MTKQMSTMDELEIILDDHAIVYGRSSARFITGKIDRQERDEQWEKSDKDTKQAIIAWADKKSLEGRKAEVRLLIAALTGNKLAYYLNPYINDRIAQLSKPDPIPVPKKDFIKLAKEVKKIEEGKDE